MQGFSLATVLGTLWGFGMIIGAILHGTDNVASFFSWEGVFIVIGGTIANAFMSYQARYVFEAFGAIWHMVKKPKDTREGLNVEMMRLIKWAYMVQTKGTIGLENEVKTLSMKNEPMLKYGGEMVATGYKPEDIRTMLGTYIESEFERRVVPVAVLKNMAGCGPAFGMVGTLVGMVIMLQNIGSDMGKIGGAMAVALLATLYGVILARLLTLPAAEKLQQKEEITRFRNYLVAEGLIMLAEKQSPRFMQDKLNSYLDPSIHFNIDTQIKG